MVTIQPQDSDEIFLVQRALLIQASEYFQKALKGHYAETERRVLRLPGCDTPTLQLFLYWLYHRTLPCFGEAQSILYVKHGSKSDIALKNAIDHQIKLFRLWGFAEAYLLPRLQNETMECLCDFLMFHRLQPAAAHVAFEVSSRDLLEYFCVKQAANDWRSSYYDEDDLTVLGGIPGFMNMMLNSIEECRQRGCLCHQSKPCRPSLQRERKSYMVG